MPDGQKNSESRGEKDARIERVEEALAFAERTIDQLSGEIADMNKRIAAMGKKIAGLEERIGKMGEGDTE